MRSTCPVDAAAQLRRTVRCPFKSDSVCRGHSCPRGGERHGRYLQFTCFERCHSVLGDASERRGRPHSPHPKAARAEPWHFQMAAATLQSVRTIGCSNAHGAAEISQDSVVLVVRPDLQVCEWVVGERGEAAMRSEPGARRYNYFFLSNIHCR